MKTSLIALFIATAAIGAQAQTATPHVDMRQDRQEQRIEQGVANGSLTAQETHRLDKQQARIDTMEAKAKADGKVTARERNKLRAAQDAASRDIHRKKHNNRQPS
jgi:uncharacterized membrane protein YebE (DUF533 family)